MYLQIHQHFSHCVLLTVLLGLTMDVTSGLISIQLIPQYPVVNGSVTLSVTGITGTLETVNWFKGPSTDSQYQILVYFPQSKDPLVPGRLYNSSFLPFSNGSLQIKDLLITDGGNYTVRIQTEKPAEDINVTLTVYVPVTKPNITAPIIQSKENDTLTLTCNTLNAMMITWTRRGTRISLQAKLSGDNKTLTFSSIKREDSGEYRCEAQNLVSKDSSDPYTITVAYGPENVKISDSVGLAFVNPGSSITLSCSADSVPNPVYEWKFMDAVLRQNTSKYTISSAETKNQGQYTCKVTNTVTGFSASASVYVNVTEEYVAQEKKDLPMIIGIVVALVLLLFLITAIIYLIMIHKRRKSSNETNSNVKESSRNGQPDNSTQSTELQYSSIEFKNMPRKEQKPEAIYENRTPQPAPAPAPASAPAENVIYSELKLR